MIFSKNMRLLLKAISSKNIKKVRQILLRNRKLCHSTVCEMDVPSPLWLAMLFGYKKIVEVLLEFGANINECLLIENSDGSQTQKISFLHYISLEKNWQRSIKIAKVLIKHGANVNAKCDLNTRLPLQIAVIQGNTPVVEFLLKNGAKPESPEWNVCSAIPDVLKAPNTKQKEILRLLVEYGLDTQFCLENGENLLHLLSISESKNNDCMEELAEILLNSGVPLNGLNNKGLSPLEVAIYLKNIKLSLFLIHKGANVNKNPEQDVWSPLIVSALAGDIKLTNLLISKGAKINDECHGKTALHAACLTRHEDIVKILIQKGANVSAETSEGKTPFSNLNFDKEKSKPCVITMVKEFSKLRFQNLSISKTDMRLIETNSKIQNLFEECTSELSQMKNTIFYYPFSYYNVLSMSKNIKKLAKLTKNSNFVKEFEENLSLFYYKDDLQKILNEAIELRDRLNIVYSRLEFVFGDYFPDVVIRKLSENLCLEDLPL